MPLVGLEVMNEYGLGDPELYMGAARREDPRAVLEGVSVSGLVGILRQLGDLVRFASTIFHDLHEQIMYTSARRHSLMARVQHIESAVPQIENAVETQKNHINFVYLPGFKWRANIPIEQDHLVGSELPQFILDSYEECHDLPCLFLLDKFDNAGAGACLKRYSDPTYFRRVWASSRMLKEEKHKKVKKAHKSKITMQRTMSQVGHSTHPSCHNGSIPPGTDNSSIVADAILASDMRLKSDVGSPASFDSRTRHICEEPVVNANFSVEHRESISAKASTMKLEMDCNNVCDSPIPGEHNGGANDDSVHDQLQEKNGPRSSIAWDEKMKILKPRSTELCNEDIVENIQNSDSSESATVIPDHVKLFSVKIKSAQLDKEHFSLSVRPIPHKNSSPDAGNLTSHTGVNHPKEFTIITDKCDHKGDIFHATCLPHHNNISSNARCLPLPCSGAFHFNEITTSETENYVDALNTLESETDTDSEVQTVREMRPSSIYSNQAENRVGDKLESGLAKSDFLEDDISKLSQEFLHKKIPPEIGSNFPKNVGHPLPVSGHDTEKSFHLNNGLCGGTCTLPKTTVDSDIANKQTSRCLISDTQTQSSVFNISKLQTATKDEKVAEVHNTPETCANSDELPVQIRTNSSLLGLEPSKFQDFIKPASLGQQSASSTSKDRCSYSATELQEDKSSTRHGEFFQLRKSILKKPTSNVESNGLHKSFQSALSTSKVRYSYSTPELEEDISSTRYGEFFQLHKSILENPSCNVESNRLHKSSGLITLCTNKMVGENEHEVGSIHPADHSPLCNDVGNKFQNSHSLTIHQKGKNLAENKVCIQGNDSSATSAEVLSTESSPRDTCNPSSLPSLARKFLASNLPKKASSNHAVVPGPSTLEANKSRLLQERSFPNDQKEDYTLVFWGYQESKSKAKLEQEIVEDKISCGVHCSGPPSPPSPPLEPMKISYRPMKRTKASKMKLEFPDGHIHDSIEELMFPSFHLLQGSAASVHQPSLDSDDDTLSMSSSSFSEHFPSHHSDSDLELWEANEQPVSLDMPDASHRVSSTASMYNSLDLDRINHHPPYSAAEYRNLKLMDNGTMVFKSDDVMDLPSLESWNSSAGKQEGRCDLGCKDPPVFAFEAPNEQLPSASPPPLPPLHWRIMKYSPSCWKNEHDCKSEIANVSVGTETQESFRQQPEHAECRPPQPPLPPLPPQQADNGKTALQSAKWMESQKINRDKGDKRVEKTAEIDEKGDFLHQIRSKSFNLRPTITTKSLARGPTTNDKVNAILEKADAIRQAVVSSDDGGDENWSDG